MKCILYNGTRCLAVGFPKEHLLQYEPTAEEQKNGCNSTVFRDCPRYLAYLDVLRCK